MNELHTIIDGVNEAGSRRESAVLATVVGVTGSAYRRPGARLLLLPDGRSIGAISGGCLEADVAERARPRCGTVSRPRCGTVSRPCHNGGTDAFVIRYDTASDEEIAWELGLGCGGVVDVLIERIDPIHPPPFLAFMKRCLEQRRPGVLARVVAVVARSGDRATTGHVRVGAWLTLEQNGETSDNFKARGLADRVRRDAADVLGQGRSRRTVYDGVEVFHELLRPSPSLLICGAGHDAPAVARFAAELGWRVTVCDRRPARAIPARFPIAELIVCRPPDLLRHFVPEPGGAAVVMTHDYLDDQCFLEALVPLPLRYIGILGSRRRTDSLLRALRAGGFLSPPLQPDGAVPQRGLHGPIGLDLGAETPEEIALAVVAEIQAVLAGRRAGFLCDKPGPIHDRSLAEANCVPRFDRPELVACAMRAD